METLRIFLHLEMWLILGGLLLLVLYQLLTGRINTTRMLCDKETKQLSPGRVQLLMLTLIGALYYLLHVAQAPTRLPDIPQELLLLLGASNTLYLGGKASPLFPGFRRGPEP